MGGGVEGVGDLSHTGTNVQRRRVKVVIIII